jgi:xanthine dehydrogenase accessory factor
MIEIYQKAVMLVKEGRRLVLATIITQQGPSPRGIGTKCLILDDGSLVGTIGGGALEARTIEEAGTVIEKGLPSRLYFSLTGADVAETDMLCGGEVEVFLEPVNLETTNSLAIFKKAAGVLGRGGAGLLATIVDGKYNFGVESGRIFFSASGEAIGSFSDDKGLDSELKERVDQILASGRPGIIPLRDISGTAVEIFVEPISSAPVLYVFGGGHVSRQIVPLAVRVGFDSIVIDDRPEFADKGLFPDAAEVRSLPFEGLLEKLVINDSSYLVIVTRGHIHDKIVLEQALKTDARYIGMIGSSRKRGIIYEKLLEEGFSKNDLSRVHSPIGLDIGADTPEEIAVSVVAELIKVRAGE